MKQPEQLREGQQTTNHCRTRDNQIKEGQVPQKWTELKSANSIHDHDTLNMR